MSQYIKCPKCDDPMEKDIKSLLVEVDENKVRHYQYHETYKCDYGCIHWIRPVGPKYPVA